MVRRLAAGKAGKASGRAARLFDRRQGAPKQQTGEPNEDKVAERHSTEEEARYSS